MIVLTGPPCSGKTSVGRLLPGTLVEVDAVFDRLLPGSDRNRADRLRGYAAAHVLARLQLEQGRSPVLECTYARRDQRASLVEALPDVPLHVVELHVTADEAVARFRSRTQQTDLDEGSLRERVEAFPYSDGALGLTSGPPEDLARLLAAWLASGPPPVDAEAWVSRGTC